MKMIYTPKKGNKITFDDFHKPENADDNPWTLICPLCYAEYADELKGKHVTDCPLQGGICGVEGCNREAALYLDFVKEEVQMTTLISVTLEKSIRVTEEFEATQEDLQILDNGDNPFFDAMADICNEENGAVEYDYSVTDEDTGKTLVEWG